MSSSVANFYGDDAIGHNDNDNSFEVVSATNESVAPMPTPTAGYLGGTANNTAPARRSNVPTGNNSLANSGYMQTASGAPMLVDTSSAMPAEPLAPVGGASASAAQQQQPMMANSTRPQPQQQADAPAALGSSVINNKNTNASPSSYGNSRSATPLAAQSGAATPSQQQQQPSQQASLAGSVNAGHTVAALPATNAYNPAASTMSNASASGAAGGAPAPLAGPGRRASDAPRATPSVRPSLSSITGLERVAAIPKLQGSSDRLQERVGTCVHNLMVAKCPERLGEYGAIMRLYEGKEEVLLDALQAVFGDEHFFGRRPDISMIANGGLNTANNSVARGTTTTHAMTTTGNVVSSYANGGGESVPRRGSVSPHTTAALESGHTNATAAMGYGYQYAPTSSSVAATNGYVSRTNTGGNVGRTSSIMTPPLPKDLQIGSSSAVVGSRVSPMPSATAGGGGGYGGFNGVGTGAGVTSSSYGIGSGPVGPRRMSGM